MVHERRKIAASIIREMEVREYDKQRLRYSLFAHLMGDRSGARHTHTLWFMYVYIYRLQVAWNRLCHRMTVDSDDDAAAVVVCCEGDVHATSSFILI